MSSTRWSKNLLTSWRGLAGLILLLALMTGSITFAQERPGYLRLVRAIPAGDVGVSNPVGLAFSPGASAFLVLEAGGAPRFEAGPFGVPHAQGLTLDPETGRLFILDAAAHRIVGIIPDAQQGFDGQIFQIDLRHLARAPLRGPAFH